MLYYKDTKLRSRRRSRKGHVYIYSTKMPLIRAPVQVVYNSATIFCKSSALALLHHSPLLKKPALRLCISPSLKEKEEKKKRNLISRRLIAMPVNIRLAAVLQLLLLLGVYHYTQLMWGRQPFYSSCCCERYITKSPLLVVVPPLRTTVPPSSLSPLLLWRVPSHKKAPLLPLLKS